MLKNHYAIEENLLWACCRKACGSTKEDAFFQDSLDQLDYQKLLFLAQEHRLLLIVNHYFIRVYKHTLNEETVSQFHAASKKIIFGQLQLSAELCKIQQSLLDVGVKHLFLKGPLLGKQLFGDTLLRYSGDIDFLVPPSEIEKAHICMTQLGYTTDCSIKTMHRYAKRKTLGQKDTVYHHPGSPFRVELHWRTMDHVAYSQPFPSPEGLSTVNFQGRNFSVLSDELNALYLMIHAARHSWSRARWLLDVLVFMKTKNLTPEQLLAAAHSKGLSRFVSEAFFLAYHVFGLQAFEAYARLNGEWFLRKRVALSRFNEGSVPVRYVSKVAQKILFYLSPNHRIKVCVYYLLLYPLDRFYNFIRQ